MLKVARKIPLRQEGEDAVAFAEAYAKRKTIHAGGLKLAFFGLDHLLVNNRSAGCPQDLVDAAKLEASLSRTKPGASVKPPRGRRKKG